MKKFLLNYWFQFCLAVLVAFCVSFGFTYFIKDWTRSDVISICAGVVLIWQVGISRWVSIPARELSVIQLDRQKREETERKQPRVSFEYNPPTSRARFDSTAPGFTVKNIGFVDIENLKIEPLMPNLDRNSQALILSSWTSPTRLSVGSSSYISVRINQGFRADITVIVFSNNSKIGEWQQVFTTA